ncbi:hypothetical protein [Butyrivibrio sp. AE3004]|uniref:hypothetical protein n=1 Tax=Butyrivibrio sp. AE3004 TaxID=1506994 RepID=UPI0004946D56|nr:hypothetical protein [Butyrivibrio sp. AE3004]
MGNYDDIINKTRPISKKHSPMPLENRAAQFMPFAALTGYDEEVSEAGRFTTSKIELTEEQKSEINEKLMEILALIESGSDSYVVITYFVPDALKDGGHYITIPVHIIKIDTFNKNLVLEDKSVILIDDILAIEK